MIINDLQAKSIQALIHRLRQVFTLWWWLCCCYSWQIHIHHLSWPLPPLPRPFPPLLCCQLPPKAPVMRNMMKHVRSLFRDSMQLLLRQPKSKQSKTTKNNSSTEEEHVILTSTSRPPWFLCPWSWNFRWVKKDGWWEVMDHIMSGRSFFDPQRVKRQPTQFIRFDQLY